MADLMVAGMWGSAAAFGFVAGTWLADAYGPRVLNWLADLLELPRKL